ncbi:ABC transporter substrate-binding protein [Xinfangfangia sp. D13-10-4-6]|uniref:ABC transporter substrate-binding protein n=1 Tax=Pseudogemmobacter hezensis TaxID=2737662 RepID=UPI001556654B|nr:ABC transporter substrate-binding protein [Pseudogemmobacter hezensis]NPD15528.1 ABC transporter substrate-binding protein [Pseudogemmobacter hezensis]
MKPFALFAALFATALLALRAPAAAQAQDFPLTIPHKFGETVILAPPARVASVDFTGADDLLALGVQPVTIRDWYGDFPDGLWPWAAPLLTTTPPLLRGELNYEQIAAQKPDVIIALWSGIGAADYERLSRIAPVVAVPAGVGDFSLPWDERAMIAGRAIGRETLASKKVAAIHAQMAAIAAAHPDWQGKTASVAWFLGGGLGAYSGQDVRVQLLASLGFHLPPRLAARVKGDGFSVPLSEEAIGLLEADVLVWTMADGDMSAPDRVVTRPFLITAKEGREVLSGKLLTGAMSHASLLSLPWALERLEPALNEAMAGKGPVLVE